MYTYNSLVGIRFATAQKYLMVSSAVQRSTKYDDIDKNDENEYCGCIMLVIGKMMAEKQKKYYTSKEAANILNVAVSTIQLWETNGLLKAWTTVGGHRRIDRASVEEMLGSHKTARVEKKKHSELSIVVVEDDPQQLRLYKKYITAWGLGAKLATAKDGYEGMIKIGSMLPDIIITDLMMPNMDGFQMMRALKDIPELSHTTIIVVSALEHAEVKANGGLPEGVHLYTKPIVFSDLEKLLRDKLQLKTSDALAS